MRSARLFLTIFIISASPLFAQNGLLTDNPLDELRQEVARVLAASDVAFSASQNAQIVLMMEERRQASEELFGNLQDFTAGPTQGQQADQLRSAIDWMQDEFLSAIGDYLTGPQRTVWEAYVSDGGLAGIVTDADPEAAPTDQTQYVRIHNNAFTAEDERYRLGRGGSGQASATEVIQRGGGGEVHGNAELLLRDDALNARNPFGQNKPDYQERQLRVDVGGPVIRNRLTSQIFFFQNEAEGVDTVNAELPEGRFELGIVRPTVARSLATTNYLQWTESVTVDFGGEYSRDKGDNQGVGGFTLPEQAYTTRGTGWNVYGRVFALLGGGDLFESRVGFTSSTDRTLPVTDTVQINVLDAFSRGGAQNLSDTTNRNYEFSGMYTRVAGAWTLKTGVEGVYRTRRSLDENNFGGTYTFSSLASFLAGQAVNYTLNQGDPLVEVRQFETALFAQHDFQLTPQFTLMAGLRYTNQTNLSDNNNFEPRISFAWAIGPNTVLRAGSGVFTYYHDLNVVEAQERFDGTRQFETIIDNPTYPDPFQAGTLRPTFPSIRITDPNLVHPYDVASGVQLERTFFTNLFLSVTYNNRQELRRYRLRDTNAPFPACVDAIEPGLPRNDVARAAQACRPDPSAGSTLNLEATTKEVEHLLRVSYRQRFSIFNVRANYTLNKTYADGAPSNQPSIPSDNYDLANDWSSTPMPRHTLGVTINAELPLGLFLTGQWTSRTGQRYSILTGRDDNRDGRLSDRPEGVGRNSEVGPNFHSLDLNISKAFFFGRGDKNVNVFANMSNAFNHLNPGRPSGVLTSPNFGRSTSAQNPREIELGVRYQF